MSVKLGGVAEKSKSQASCSRFENWTRLTKKLVLLIKASGLLILKQLAARTPGVQTRTVRPLRNFAVDEWKADVALHHRCSMPFRFLDARG